MICSLGIWVTTNGGTAWQRRVNGFTWGIGYTGTIALAVSPVDAGLVIAGSWETGISRTTDYGENWTKLSSGLPNYPGWTLRASGIFFDEGFPSNAYVGFAGNVPAEARGYTLPLG